MVSVEAYFGEKAGIVWGVLKQNGPLSVAVLKRRTQLSSTELYAALGWLARENKIRITGESPLKYRFALNEQG